MNSKILLFITAALLTAIPVFPQAKNVILFIGDGAGISSMNAASIYCYGQPQALYLQSRFGVGLELRELLHRGQSHTLSQ